VLRLADRAIGNLQQWPIGAYHCESRGRLQAYLDEFEFRYKRRRQPRAAFQMLLGPATGRQRMSYRRIRSTEDLSKPPAGSDHNLLWSAETTG
jgi:hypothetical protein